MLATQIECLDDTALIELVQELHGNKGSVMEMLKRFEVYADEDRRADVEEILRPDRVEQPRSPWVP